MKSNTPEIFVSSYCRTVIHYKTSLKEDYGFWRIIFARKTDEKSEPKNMQEKQKSIRDVAMENLKVTLN